MRVIPAILNGTMGCLDVFARLQRFHLFSHCLQRWGPSVDPVSRAARLGQAHRAKGVSR